MSITTAGEVSGGDGDSVATRSTRAFRTVELDGVTGATRPSRCDQCRRELSVRLCRSQYSAAVVHSPARPPLASSKSPRLPSAASCAANLLVLKVVAYNLETLVLGVSRLDVDWVLGPSARWGLYAFDLEVNRVLTDEERQHVRTVVELMKPSHTHFVQIVEPVAPVPDGRWVLGEDDLGTRVLA